MMDLDTTEFQLDLYHKNLKSHQLYIRFPKKNYWFIIDPIKTPSSS
uniref:Uncharacterized protein n=1 Tax=Rhizophora mucronata TaxID=61149 RepID=A0A2P2P741_RHIMU